MPSWTLSIKLPISSIICSVQCHRLAPGYNLAFEMLTAVINVQVNLYLHSFILFMFSFFFFFFGGGGCLLNLFNMTMVLFRKKQQQQRVS